MVTGCEKRILRFLIFYFLLFILYNIYLCCSKQIGMEPIHLILTRHGETFENRRHVMQGHTPGTLSPKGIRQAKELAFTLSGESLDVIICSDLARSYDTAMIVAKSRGMSPHSTLLLREIDWGVHTGGRLDKLDWENLPEGCETLKQLFQRAVCFIDYLKQNYPGKHILAVGHGAINRAITAYLTGGQASDMPNMPIMENTSYFRFTIE